jgi:assimilatory nitrate reductase catalytic subunit
MTRTGVSPRLSAHIHEPFVEVNPLDAAQYGLTDRSLARINGPLEKSVIVRVQYSDKQQRGSIFLPIHWNGQFSSRANVGALIPSVVDPISGQPESKHGIVNIEPYVGNWHGFILSNNSTNLDLGFAKYWVKSRGRGFWRYEMAGYHCGPNWAAFSKELLGTISEDEWIEYFDKSNHTYRAAQFRGSKLINIIFIGPNEKLPPRDWLISLFQKEEISISERMSLLSGKPPADQEDAGKTVCACFNVGEKTILKAINEKGLTTPEQIGECLQAGTNCGSCLPELRGILASNTFASA